ncbi:centlein isoform X2 [Amia ocellicauda]|uniref:centlein isoform X2 n=1 Tax=Amia ocellicauda TaxID=2972642 RepID=UPI0034638E46
MQHITIIPAPQSSLASVSLTGITMATKQSDQGRILLLEEEIRSLSEELVQCQADKEFVWSLWKRLQVANPDLTQAVSLVVEREKQKAEAKDRKVLEILHIKDSKIQELEQRVTGQQQEINNLLQRKISVDEEKGLMKKELTALRQKVEDKSQELKDFKERTKKKEQEQRRVVRDLEEGKEGLDARCSDLLSDLEKLQKQAAQWRQEKSGIDSKVKVLEDDIKAARQQVEEMHNKCNDLAAQLGSREAELGHREADVTKLRTELQEMRCLYQQSTEHAAQQAELIQQLETLHLDAQKVLRNQEDAHTHETISYQKLYNELSMCYEALKSSETQLRQSHVSLTTQLHQKEQQISQLQARLLQTLPTSCQQQRQANATQLEEQQRRSSGELESVVATQSAELSRLREQLQTVNARLATLSSDGAHSRTQGPESRRRDPPAKRSRSLSPTGREGAAEGTQRLRMAESRIRSLEELVELKNQENAELRRAHEKRHDRLRLIQTNYRTVKEQLREAEDGQGKAGGRARGQRAEPWQLRQEDSDAVWNELAYFRREHRKLLTEKVNQDEELDVLRVQSAADRAALQEVRVCLEHERQELRSRLGEDGGVRSSTPKKEGEDRAERSLKQVAQLERKLRTLEKEMERLKETNAELGRARDTLQASLARLRSQGEAREAAAREEREQLLTAVAELEGRVSALRRQAAGAKELRRERGVMLRRMQELRRELGIARAARGPGARGPPCCRAGAAKVRLRAARPGTSLRRRQVFLNQSIKEQSAVFEDFNRDGWEDLSADSDSAEGSWDSLGEVTARSARIRRPSRETDDSAGSSGESDGTRDTPPRRPGPRPGPRLFKGCANCEKEKRKVQKDKSRRPRSTDPSQQEESKQEQKRQKQSGAQKRRLSLALQQRIVSLKQQISVLQAGWRDARRTARELRETNKQTTSQMNSLAQRLQISKQVSQKLTSDLAALQLQKDELEREVGQLKQQLQTLTDRAAQEAPPPAPRPSQDPPGPSPKQLETEIKHLQNKLKIASNEVTRHTAANKALKADLQEKEEQIGELQDKVSRMERDVGMKRHLVEDFKSRMKSFQENDKTHRQLIEELEKKVKTLSEEASNRKTCIDSLKQRLSVATKEKSQYELTSRKLRDDLDKKSQKLQELQSKVAECEAAMAELEETASQQMHGLALQSGQALEGVQKKLGLAHRQREELVAFIKTLALEMHSDSQETRAQIRKARKRRQEGSDTGLSTESMSRAQSIAASILNMSQADLQDMLDTEQQESEDVRAERRKDQDWLDRVQGILGQQAVCRDRAALVSDQGQFIGRSPLLHI